LAALRLAPCPLEPPMNAFPTRSAYTRQKLHCKGRTDVDGIAIEMRLTFEQWAHIWQQSGKWEQRGRRRGQYVMARHNDRGHYELGNVSIITFGDNVRQADHTHTAASKARISKSKTGSTYQTWPVTCVACRRSLTSKGLSRHFNAEHAWRTA
jgi:hypothetical protein